MSGMQLRAVLEDGGGAMRRQEGQSRVARASAYTYELLDPVRPLRQQVFKGLRLGVAAVGCLVAGFVLGHVTARHSGPSLDSLPADMASQTLEFSVPLEPNDTEDLGSNEAPARQLRLHINLPVPTRIWPPRLPNFWDADLMRGELDMDDMSVKKRYLRWFKKVGCFRLSQTDVQREAEKITFMDLSCVKAEGNSDTDPCASGMPFYRMLMQEKQSHQDCMMFCLSKSLDMHAVKRLSDIELARAQAVGDVTWECRCGATKRNHLWKEMGGAEKKKRPNFQDKVPSTSDECRMFVWRYTGPMVLGSVPYIVQNMGIDDEGYIDSIAWGEMMTGREEDKPSAEMRPRLRLSSDMKIEEWVLGDSRRLSEQHAEGRRLGVCHDSANPGITIGGRPAACRKLYSYCRQNNDIATFVRGVCPLTCRLCSAGSWLPCYPYQCAGGGPWTTKAHNGNTYIRYYWGPGITEDRKDAFRTAAKEFQQKTCIRFSEQSNPRTPRMKVYVHDRSTCDASVGFPGDGGEAMLNMGWCHSLSHVGSIIHELGHIIGMNHEQNRPDGSRSFNSPEGRKDAKLNVAWQNISPMWRVQYEPLPASYVGSNQQGNSRGSVDTFSGYSQYDYESIMHYGRFSPSGSGNAYSTRNPVFNSVVGQRTALSDDDLRQIADMYQCKLDLEDEYVEPTPLPTMPPPPSPSMPTPRTGPVSSGCSDGSPPNGWRCNGGACSCGILASYCKNPYYGPDLRRSCPFTCGACGGGAQCQDVAPPGWNCNGRPCTCRLLAGFCHDPMYGPGVSAACRATCNQC